MNWNTIIRQFENYVKLERSLSDNSVLAYVRDVAKLREFLEISNQETSPQDVTEKQLSEFLQYINELGMSRFSQARMLSGVKSFFRFLKYEEIIEQDPSALIEAPRLGRKLPDTLSVEEIDMMLTAIDMSTPEGTRNRAMLETLYSSGLRVSELIQLRISNIYFDVGFLRIIGKGNKEGYAAFGNMTEGYLRKWLDEYQPKPEPDSIWLRGRALQDYGSVLPMPGRPR